MATTQNTFTGNGSNLGPFSFTFKWLESTDIKVTVAGVLKTAGTHYNLQSLNYTTRTGGQVLFTAGNAPANGAAIVVYRQTDDSDLVSTFYSGSAIRAQDLNSNFTQNLYVTQEANNSSATATSTANSALTASATATSTANAATSTANSAVSTANSAVSTANSAVSTANSAVSTANAASASAASAVSTANTANANATAALNAAAEALAYVIVANVAAIPASPVNGDAIRVTDSTGIESFTPLSGKPVGFVGDAGLTVEIYYSSSTSSWVWVRYYATNPDTRYQAYNVNNAVTDVAQTFTKAQRGAYVTLTDAATIATDLSLSNQFQVTLGGSRTLGAPTNVVAGQSGVIRVVQDGSGGRTLAYNSVFKFPGGTAPTLTTTANAVDLLAYHVESTTRIAVRFIGDVK